MADYSRGKVAAILAALKPLKHEEVPEGLRLTVPAAVSRFSVLYEKIRNAIDYSDEHLLRKSAIARILKRQLSLETDANTIARKLTRELIAARYLPNGTLPESIVAQAAVVIRKYQVLKRTRVGGDVHFRWLFGITAAELEEVLADQSQEKALVNFLFEQLGDRIQVRGVEMDDTERRLQSYIACHRALFKFDDQMIGYKLVRAYHAQWMRPEEWMSSPDDMSLRMVGVGIQVEHQLKHAYAQKFLRAVKPWAISLVVLRDALLEKPDGMDSLLDDQTALHASVSRIAERKMKASRGKLRRGMVRAIIYLFITKILLALAIEVPFEYLLFHQVHRASLLTNVLFPPILMFLVGSLIKLPGKENVQRIKHGVDELLSQEGPAGREVKIVKKKTWMGRFFLSLTYVVMFLVTFGLIFFFLNRIHFTWVSSMIFIFFLCIVSFFAFRLRLAAREFVVVDPKERSSGFLLDFFSYPILRAGQQLSRSVSRINIFIFFFDFIIETPFKIFLGILEEWLGYMKEKKEELQ